MKRIPLDKGMVALVSDRDHAHLSKFKWHAKRGYHQWYAARNYWRGKKCITVRMHRVIAGATRGQEVDHRDTNGLNNTRRNLRICSKAQNTRNARKLKRVTSRYKGVRFCKSGARKWQAFLQNLYLGVFHTQREAAKAYDRAAKKKYGRFARLNFPTK